MVPLKSLAHPPEVPRTACSDALPNVPVDLATKFLTPPRLQVRLRLKQLRESLRRAGSPPRNCGVGTED